MWVLGQEWMAFFGGPWRSNLSLSVCPRETWRSQCLDFTHWMSPFWFWLTHGAPVDTHKDSLFATVTAHPHERESQTQTSASKNWMYITVNILKKECSWGGFDCAWNLILHVHYVFFFTKSLRCPWLGQKAAVQWHWTFVLTLRLPCLFHESLRWLDKVLFTVALGYFWPR